MRAAARAQHERRRRSEHKAGGLADGAALPHTAELKLKDGYHQRGNHSAVRLESRGASRASHAHQPRERSHAPHHCEGAQQRGRSQHTSNSVPRPVLMGVGEKDFHTIVSQMLVAMNSEMPEPRP